MSVFRILLLALAGFYVFFVLLWLLVCFILSRAGGWHRLARAYPAGPEPMEDGRRRRSGFLRGVSYKNCLVLGGDARGLYLAITPIFRFQHPPLRIPWPDLELEAGPQIRGRTYLRLIAARESSVPILLREEEQGLLCKYLPPPRARA